MFIYEERTNRTGYGNRGEMNPEKFQMGLVQREWVASLERNGEIQTDGRLGFVHPKLGYMACCLGELIVTEARVFDFPPPLCNGNIFSPEGGMGYLYEGDAERLGLISGEGKLRRGYNVDAETSYKSLGEMNDGGVPWPVIANYIRENPEKVFTHPY